jgi:hypothetical protein
MKKGTPIPTLTSIVWTDYTAFFQAAIIVVVWIIYIAWVPKWTARGPIIAPWMAPYILYFAIFMTLIGLTIITWRVILLRRIFRGGEQVQGKIIAFSMRRDRGRVDYGYIYKGVEYQCRASVHRTMLTNKLKAGERVTLVVDRKNPKHAYIQHIYI